MFQLASQSRGVSPSIHHARNKSIRQFDFRRIFYTLRARILRISWYQVVGLPFNLECSQTSVLLGELYPRKRSMNKSKILNWSTEKDVQTNQINRSFNAKFNFRMTHGFAYQTHSIYHKICIKTLKLNQSGMIITINWEKQKYGRWCYRYRPSRSPPLLIALGVFAEPFWFPTFFFRYFVMHQQSQWRPICVAPYYPALLCVCVDLIASTEKLEQWTRSSCQRASRQQYPLPWFPSKHQGHRVVGKRQFHESHGTLWYIRAAV